MNLSLSLFSVSEKKKYQKRLEIKINTVKRNAMKNEVTRPTTKNLERNRIPKIWIRLFKYNNYKYYISILICIIIY